MSKPSSFSDAQRGVQPRNQHGSSPSVSPFRTKIWPKGQNWCARPLGGFRPGLGSPGGNPSHLLLFLPREHPGPLPCRNGSTREAGKDSKYCFTVLETEAPYLGWQALPIANPS